MRVACTSLLGTVLAVGTLALSDRAGARSATGNAAVAGISSHLQVMQIEYRLILSRGVVKAGPLNLQAIDAGMDPHDLRLRRESSKQEITTPELTPGKRWDTVVDLRPGTYKLWCSLPEHAKLGMRATLRVLH
jgi:hypothetical protein